MALDDSVVDRRRFAQLFGLDGEPGAGLPVGPSGGRRRVADGDGRRSGSPVGPDGRTTRTDGGAPGGPGRRKPTGRNGETSPE